MNDTRGRAGFLVMTMLFGAWLLWPLGLQASEYPAPWTNDELRVYLDRMNKGDLDAYYDIGRAMVEGDRLKQDIDGGIKYLEHAADRGHGESMLVLVDYYDMTRNVVRGKLYLERALGSSDPVVHYTIAKWLGEYRFRQLIPSSEQRKKQQVDSLTFAAERNVPQAMYDLARHYAPTDPERALHWYEQGAMHEEYYSIINLAIERTKRAPAGPQEALKYLQAAIDKVAARSPNAAGLLRFMIGEEYESSSELKLDRAEAANRAAYFYNLVVNDEQLQPQLRQFALLRIARISVEFGGDEAHARALAYMQGQAAQGSPQAQCFLAEELSYREDGILPYDPEAADRWGQELVKSVHRHLGLPASCGGNKECEKKSEEALNQVCLDIYAQ